LVFCGPRAMPWVDRFCPFRAEDADGTAGVQGENMPTQAWAWHPAHTSVGMAPGLYERGAWHPAYASGGQADMVVVGIVRVEGVRGNGLPPRRIFPMFFGTGGIKKLARG